MFLCVGARSRDRIGANCHLPIAREMGRRLKIPASFSDGTSLLVSLRNYFLYRELDASSPQLLLFELLLELMKTDVWVKYNRRYDDEEDWKE